MSGELDDGAFLADLLASWDGDYGSGADGATGETHALALELALGSPDDAAGVPEPQGERLIGAGGGRARGSAAGVKHGKRRNDPNKARNERIREIRQLRHEVTELTAKMGALKALTARLPRAAATTASATGGEGAAQVVNHVASELVGLPPVWEAICHNQLSRRLRSERENARLKRALEDQLKLAYSLAQGLKEPEAGQPEPDDLGVNSTNRMYTLPSDSDADGKLFDMLVAEADAAYNEIDGIFQLNGIGGPISVPARGSNLHEGEHGRFVDMFSSTILPFELEVTSDVVWRFYSGTSKHRGPLYYKTAKTLETSKDTIIEKFAIELFGNNMRGDFRIWQVMRRYVEADRVMVVWMSVIEPVEFANKPFSSCAIREKGYVVCKPAIGSSVDGSPAKYTQLLQCHRIAPYTTHAADTVLSDHVKREIGALLEFWLNIDSIGVYLEMFEDELVRGSLRQLPHEAH